MRKLLISLASVALAVALAVAPAATAKPTKPKATIVETVISLSGPSGFDDNHGDFDILRDAAVATGLDARLDGKRQLTVFAPSDQAFLDLTGATNEADAFDTVASLGLPAVKKVLKYHIAPGKRGAKQVVAAKTVRTQAPAPVEKVPEPPPVIAETTAVSPITLPVVEPPPAPVAQAAVAPEPPPIIPPRFNADYLQNPAPAYPPLARRMHEQGRVLIRVLVSVDGMPEKIELKASSGYPRLDQSALETIRNWKFVPARQGDQKVTAWVIVPITFTLDA